MRGGPRAQVTAFFLVGLAVLLVLLLVFLLRNALLARNPVARIGEAHDVQAIREYVGGCIDLATEDAVTTAMRQGGELSPAQGDAARPGLDAEVRPTLAQGVVSPVGINVSFGLVATRDWPFRPPLPGSYPASVRGTQDPYPFPDIALTTLAARIAAYWSAPLADGPFGQYALPPLCDPLGPNSLNASVNRADARCPSYLFPLHDVKSLQEGLGAAIAAATKRCVVPARLEELLGSRVAVGAAAGNVTFTPTESIVDVTLPLTFSGEGTYEAHEFTRRYPLRILPLWNFAFNLLKNASKDAAFRLNDSADYERMRGYDRFGVSVQRVPAAQADGRTDLFLVLITDPTSRLGNDALFLQFLVQDRAPVLDAYPDMTLPPGQRVLTVDATDPDGDPLEATLALSPQGQGAMREIPSVSGQPPLTITIPAGQADGPYTANLSVTDPAGRSDWQAFTLTLLSPPPGS